MNVYSKYKKKRNKQRVIFLQGLVDQILIRLKKKKKTTDQMRGGGGGDQKRLKGGEETAGETLTK